MKSLKTLACLCPLLLAACGSDIRETLGLGKDAPDEFVVVSRPPLSVPPDFQLRPPAEAGAAPAAPSSTEIEAQKTLFGTAVALDASKQPNVATASTPASTSDADTGPTSTFLNKAGADQAAPDIRQQLSVDAKTPPPEKEAGSLIEELNGKEKADPVVDAQKETQRLQENKQEGKPVTEGDTPTAAPESKSVLDRIF